LRTVTAAWNWICPDCIAIIVCSSEAPGLPSW